MTDQEILKEYAPELLPLPKGWGVLEIEWRPDSRLSRPKITVGPLHISSNEYGERNK